MLPFLRFDYFSEHGCERVKVVACSYAHVLHAQRLILASCDIAKSRNILPRHIRMRRTETIIKILDKFATIDNRQCTPLV